MRHALSTVGACGLCLVSVSPAYAYLDAGTGSILLQVIIGVVAAGLAVLTGWRGRIRAVWLRCKSKVASKPNVQSETGER